MCGWATAGACRLLRCPRRAGGAVPGGELLPGGVCCADAVPGQHRQPHRGCGIQRLCGEHTRRASARGRAVFAHCPRDKSHLQPTRRRPNHHRLRSICSGWCQMKLVVIGRSGLVLADIPHPCKFGYRIDHGRRSRATMVQQAPSQRSVQPLRTAPLAPGRMQYIILLTYMTPEISQRKSYQKA